MNWAELLKRLKGAHDRSDQDLASVEKRTSWRVSRQVHLQALRGAEAMEIVATNFGPGGMRAETPHRLRQDECHVSVQNPREKRRAPRVHADRMSAAFATDDGEISSARVLDLAVGGVQLLSPRKLPRGASLDLKIVLARDLPPLLCRGTVVRSSSEGQLRTVELAVAFTDVAVDHKERLVFFVSRLLRG